MLKQTIAIALAAVTFAASVAPAEAHGRHHRHHGHHHGGVSIGFGYGPAFFAPRRYYAPRGYYYAPRRVYRPAPIYVPQPAPWQTAPSAPVQTYSAPQAAPAQPYTAPTTYTQPSVASQTYAPAQPTYESIGEYQGPVSTGVTSSTTINGSAPITVVPADANVDFGAAQPVYTAPYQPQQAIPTVPIN